MMVWKIKKKYIFFFVFSHPGGSVSLPGVRESGCIYGKLPDDLGGFTCMQYFNFFLFKRLLEVSILLNAGAFCNLLCKVPEIMTLSILKGYPKTDQYIFICHLLEKILKICFQNFPSINLCLYLLV